MNPNPPDPSTDPSTDASAAGDAAVLPEGVRLVRSTPEFTAATVPAGLLAAHQVADGVWGVLHVLAGQVRFVFEADPSAGGSEHAIAVGPGDHVVIPPRRLHHVEPGQDARFLVEFHR